MSAAPLPDPSTESPTQRRERQRLELARTRAWAVALLLAALALWGISRWRQADGGVWPWLQAFAEAAVVGALADWFAVVALFRRPLGLPIPHTAIVPGKKAKVADALAHFIRDRFLEPASLLQRLREWQPVERLSRWLESPSQQQWLGEQLVKLALGALHSADDARMRHALGDLLRRQMERLDLGRLASGVLTLLRESGRQSALLEGVLRQTAQWLDEPAVQDAVAEGLIEVAGREYPKTLTAIGWVADTSEYSQRIAQSLLAGARGWLRAVASDPMHPRRLWLEEKLIEAQEHLRDDPVWRDAIARWQTRLLDDPRVAAWLHDGWDRLKLRLQEDLGTPGSALHGHVMDLARGLAQTLARQPDLRADLQGQLERGAVNVVHDLRDGITRHIAQTVRQWDEQELVQTLELSVGKDLQYIRLNGTVVGGCIGVTLYALERWLMP